MIKLKRGTFQHVESELYAYHDTKKELTEMINDIVYGRPSDDENVGGGRGSLPGDPTLRRATVLATHRMLESMQKTIQAIDDVYERARPEYRRLIEIRYWKRPQTLNWDGVAQELRVSRKQAIQWRNAVILAVAEKLGWS